MIIFVPEMGSKMCFCTYKRKKTILPNLEIWRSFISQLDEIMDRRKKKESRLYIRLTSDEVAAFKAKASQMPRQNMSFMVRNAVMSYNPINDTNRFATIKELGDRLSNATTELNHIGNNVNQIAHVLNVDLLNRLERLQANRDVQYEQITKQMEIVIAAINEIKRIELKIYKNVL